MAAKQDREENDDAKVSKSLTWVNGKIAEYVPVQKPQKSTEF
jgi:hypothetical protein